MSVFDRVRAYFLLFLFLKYVTSFSTHYIVTVVTIVLTADHGMHHGEKGIWEKWSLFDESTHVPLMMYHPLRYNSKLCLFVRMKVF